MAKAKTEGGQPSAKWVLAKIGDIKRNPKNPRTIKDHKFNQLVQSIMEFPEMLQLRPIVVNAQMMVLGGNMRLSACIEAGLKEVPVIVADELTEAQQQEFIIKDNVSFGEWDWAAIGEGWGVEVVGEWGLERGAWETPQTTNAKAQEDSFEVPEGGIETDIVLGDIITIGRHRLMCGDATNKEDLKVLMGGKVADLLLTDLPYGVSYASKNEFLNNLDKGNRVQTKIENDHIGSKELYGFAKSIYTTIAPFMASTSSYYAFMPQGGEQMMMMMALDDSGFQVKHELIWIKNNHVLGRSDYNYKHEPICYGWKKGGTHKFYAGFKTSLFEFDKPVSSKLHPTMKPIALIGELVGNSTKNGDIVVDPTSGSGSTMVACHQSDRICYGLEIDPKYCQVIINRMLALDPSLEITKNGVPYGKD